MYASVWKFECVCVCMHLTVQITTVPRGCRWYACAFRKRNHKLWMIAIECILYSTKHLHTHTNTYTDTNTYKLPRFLCSAHDRARIFSASCTKSCSRFRYTENIRHDRLLGNAERHQRAAAAAVQYAAVKTGVDAQLLHCGVTHTHTYIYIEKNPF